MKLALEQFIAETAPAASSVVDSALLLERQLELAAYRT